jgi:hypothetical protein
MRRRNRWLLVLVALSGMALMAAFGSHLPGPTLVHGDSGPWLSFAPAQGAGDDVRQITFAGFAGDEVLDLTFFAPDGSQALVGGGTTWYVAPQPDGSGGPASFRPSDWPSSDQPGTWTVNIVGENTGVTLTATFVIS